MIILWLKVPSMLIYTNMENVYDQSFSENFKKNLVTYDYQ